MVSRCVDSCVKQANEWQQSVHELLLRTGIRDVFLDDAAAHARIERARSTLAAIKRGDLEVKAQGKSLPRAKAKVAQQKARAARMRALNIERLVAEEEIVSKIVAWEWLFERHWNGIEPRISVRESCEFLGVDVGTLRELLIFAGARQPVTFQMPPGYRWELFHDRDAEDDLSPSEQATAVLVPEEEEIIDHEEAKALVAAASSPDAIVRVADPAVTVVDAVGIFEAALEALGDA